MSNNKSIIRWLKELARSTRVDYKFKLIDEETYTKRIYFLKFNLRKLGGLR